LRSLRTRRSEFEEVNALRRPTIHDVARRAGVSVGTASNVINKKLVVGNEKKEQVLRAAEEIGYRPNKLARGLRQQRTDVVGLSLPLISSAFYFALAESIEGIAASRGRTLMQVLTHGDPELEYARVAALVDRRVDGIILVPSRAPERALDLLDQNKVPTILLGRGVDAENRFDSVTINEAGAMEAVVTHLASLGHRRILYLVRYPELSVTRRRIAALERLAKSSDTALQAKTIAFGDDQERFERELPLLLKAKERPTALIASNSIIALWMTHVLQRLKLAWPADISCVAFEEPVWGDLIVPQLTVVRQPVDQLAQVAWERLSARMSSKGAKTTQHIVLDADLLIRGSTGPFPGAAKQA
jgi:LacI family transcriptional regulator